jgi:hypothetical protein
MDVLPPRSVLPRARPSAGDMGRATRRATERERTGEHRTARTARGESLDMDWRALDGTRWAGQHERRKTHNPPLKLMAWWPGQARWAPRLAPTRGSHPFRQHSPVAPGTMVPFPKPGDVRACRVECIFWLVIRMAGRRSGSHPLEHVVDQDVHLPVVGVLHLAPLAQRPVGLVEEPMCPASFSALKSWRRFFSVNPTYLPTTELGSRGVEVDPEVSGHDLGRRGLPGPARFR